MRFMLVSAMMLISTTCYSQEVHAVIGGVDTRVPPLALSILAHNFDTVTEQLSLKAAELEVLKHDDTEMQQQLEATKAWLAVAWPAYAATFSQP